MKYVIPEGKKAYNGQFIVKTKDENLDVAVDRKWIFDIFHEKVVKSVKVHGIRDQFFPVKEETNFAGQPPDHKASMGIYKQVSSF